MPPWVRLVFTSLLLGAVSGCGFFKTYSSGAYYQDDGPPARGPDPSSVSNPIPREEPLSRTGNAPYVVFGVRYSPMKAVQSGYTEKGEASWYGRKFHGRTTSSGEPYDMFEMTAAHKTLPLPSYVQVRNLRNGAEVIVRVNDRGPFLGGRILDLSYMAAQKLDVVDSGTAPVQITVMRTAGSVAAAQPSGGSHSSPVILQAGSFRLQENAERLRSDLSRSNVPLVFVEAVKVDETRYYRVRAGPFKDASEIRTQASRIERISGVAPKVIRVE